MSYFYWPTKDPSAVLNFGVNWRKLKWLLTGENIVASTFVIEPAGELDVLGDDFTDDACSIWLANGTPGTTYTITNHITTSSTPIAREDSRRVYLTVDER